MEDTMEETHATTTPPPDDLTLVALTPGDMATTQAELLAWCDRKVAAVKTELADLEANLELATAHGWKHASVVASLNRTAKRVSYYEKIQAAVAAGYLIVPNFPIDVFAVRVQRAKQREQSSGYRHNLRYQTATPELLPAGTGHYVDDRLAVEDRSHTELVEGKSKHVPLYVSGDYAEVDFPVTLVKPAVLQATARAMALRVFDEMGTVQNSARLGDPIVVGRLRDPRGNGRGATFFVAWWLDTASL